MYDRDDDELSSIAEIPENTLHVLASCHSLVCLEDTLVGDPLEKAALHAVDWRLTKGNYDILVCWYSEALHGLSLQFTVRLNKIHNTETFEKQELFSLLVSSCTSLLVSSFTFLFVSFIHFDSQKINSNTNFTHHLTLLACIILLVS